MKVALVFAVVAVSIALTSAALTCWGDKEKCEEDECCVKFGPVGRCKKLHEQGDRCEIHPGKALIPNHVYMLMCPCQDGLKCVAKDGIIGKVFGTCEEDSGENPEPEE